MSGGDKSFHPYKGILSVIAFAFGLKLLFSPGVISASELFLRAKALSLYAGYPFAGFACGEVYAGVKPLKTRWFPGFYVGGGAIDFIAYRYRKLFVDTGWVGGGTAFELHTARERGKSFFLDVFIKYAFYTRKSGDGKFKGSRAYSGVSLVKCWRAGCADVTAGFHLSLKWQGEAEEKFFIYVSFSALNALKGVEK